MYKDSASFLKMRAYVLRARKESRWQSAVLQPKLDRQQKFWPSLVSASTSLFLAVFGRGSLRASKFCGAAFAFAGMEAAHISNKQQ
jgi:hypothetical protein